MEPNKEVAYWQLVAVIFAWDYDLPDELHSEHIVGEVSNTFNRIKLSDDFQSVELYRDSYSTEEPMYSAYYENIFTIPEYENMPILKNVKIIDCGEFMLLLNPIFKVDLSMIDEDNSGINAPFDPEAVSRINEMINFVYKKLQTTSCLSNATGGNWFSHMKLGKIYS